MFIPRNGLFCSNWIRKQHSPSGFCRTFRPRKILHSQVSPASFMTWQKQIHWWLFFSAYFIYIYIMCLTMFRWIRGHTFHPPVTLYIYVHSWVLRETGVFYSWTWIIMLFSFLPHFSYQGCFRPNQFEVVWFCDLRPMYYSPVVPWALAWVVSRRESCFHSACKVWPSEISFVILCKTCLALCLCRTASCTVKAHWCRIFSFFFKLLIFNILRFQELVSWV
jgi:hypothetical protein